MAKNREKLAALLGAKIVGEVPDVGGGVFGMIGLMHFVQRRRTPNSVKASGRITSKKRERRPADRDK
jgi:hypothetical protein